jgi:hypothetical protein
VSVAAVAPVSLQRTEIEIAADTIAAIFAARLIPMSPSKIKEVAVATVVPVSAIKDAWNRRDAGLYRPPNTYRPADDEPEPRDMSRGGSTKGDRRPPNRTIPDDATEWRCRTCKTVKPIDQFQVRYESRRADGRKYPSRRTSCDECRKRYQRDRYLSVETSARLGTLLRFVVQHGDPCVDDTCQRCHGLLLVGQEVETGDVLLSHAECSEQGGIL